jgi:hypothetical protein
MQDALPLATIHIDPVWTKHTLTIQSPVVATHTNCWNIENKSLKLNVLLTVHHNISVQWNQRDAIFIKIIKK